MKLYTLDLRSSLPLASRFPAAVFLNLLSSLYAVQVEGLTEGTDFNTTYVYGEDGTLTMKVKFEVFVPKGTDVNIVVANPGALGFLNRAQSTWVDVSNTVYVEQEDPDDDGSGRQTTKSYTDAIKRRYE